MKYTVNACRPLLTTLATGTLLLILSSCSHRYDSVWMDKPIHVSGTAANAEPEFRFSNGGNDMEYAVANDSKNIYIAVKTANDAEQIKILRAGMEVWIDTTGNKEQQVVIACPLQSQALNRPPHSSGTEEPQYTVGRQTDHKFDMSQLKQRYLQQLTSMNLVGFSPSIDGISPIQNAHGILVNITLDTVKDILLYKAIIPFSTFYSKPFSRRQTKKYFGVTIQVNGLDRSLMANRRTGGAPGNMPGQGSGFGGGRGGGRGMGGGGMGRGGGRGGSMAGEEPNTYTDPNSCFVKVKLAAG